MKRNQKLLAGLISAAMIVNLGFADVLAIAVGEIIHEAPAVSEPDVQISEDGHAYDPIAELEAEQAYRETAKIVAHRIIFSVLDYRAEGEDAAYWDSSAPLCSAAGLTDVSFIMDTLSETAEPREGFTALRGAYRFG